jgi:type I restriction enzyme S subunit
LTVILSDLCELIVDCEHKTAPPVPDGSYPLIRTPDIGLGVLNIESAQRVDEETYRGWTKRSVPREGDLILAREAPVGNVGMVPPGVKPVLGQRTVLIRTRSDVLDSCYLNYLMSGPELRGWMEGVSIGATVPHLNMADIRAMELPPLPSIATQRKTAAVLSAYDDLIENNNRRIKVLEEMAQRIYREWFVDYRYPGHQGVRLVDSDLGPVPEGWDVLPLSDLVGTQYGYTESASTEIVGPHFLRGMDVNKTTYIDWAAVPYCPISTSDYERYRLAPGDVVVIRMADPGKVGIVESETEAVFASYLIRVRPHDQRITPYFLFYFMSADRYQGFVSGASTGTTRKSLSAPLITSIAVALPPPAVQDAFVGCVTPVRTLLTRLISTNANLRATRDLLLPRLLSGDVDVSDLDIAVAEAIA